MMMTMMDLQGELHLTESVCPRDFLGELDYWGLSALHLEPCCAYTLQVMMMVMMMMMMMMMMIYLHVTAGVLASADCGSRCGLGGRGGPV